jgi:mRNA interferase RelE/StbE
MALYQVEVTRQVREEIRRLPGNVRQRILRTLKALKENPRPHNSQLLDPNKVGIELESGVELHRIRLEAWRIVYLVETEWQLILVLAIRKRPPYQYDDLEELITNRQR